jgi:hypothetical protein
VGRSSELMDDKYFNLFVLAHVLGKCRHGEIVNYLLARSAKEELMSSLALFVLKARALKLYRSALRASRSAPKDTRGETPHWHHWKDGILR